MIWAWDADKNRANIRKHGISFDDAQRVFDDPLAALEPDPHQYESRFRIIGMVGGAIVMVIYTLTASEYETTNERGRIISARYATPRERRRYEERR